MSPRVLGSALLLLLAAPPAAALRRTQETEELDRERLEEELARHYSANLSARRECKGGGSTNVGQLAPLILPQFKIAFCYVPKVGCTQFKDLFNWLNRIPGARYGFGTDYWRSTPGMLGLNPWLITRENGWKFAVFTRDPAARYLSAFRSTCMSSQWGTFEHAVECCGPTVPAMPGSPDRVIRMFHERIFSDLEHGRVSENDHWASQVRIFQQCGWENFDPRRVDFHGDISRGNVNEQVVKMLSISGPLDEDIRKTVDWFFPKDHIAGHKGPHNEIPPEMFFNNVTALRALMKLYQEDYEILPNVGQGFTAVQLAKSPPQRAAEWRQGMQRIRLQRQTGSEAA